MEDSIIKFVIVFEKVEKFELNSLLKFIFKNILNSIIRIRRGIMFIAVIIIFKVINLKM